MIEKEKIEKKIKELKAQREQLIAQLHAYNGALQCLNELLNSNSEVKSQDEKTIN